MMIDGPVVMSEVDLELEVDTRNASTQQLINQFRAMSKSSLAPRPCSLLST